MIIPPAVSCEGEEGGSPYEKERKTEQMMRESVEK